jgi:hypothetical protein
MNERNQDDAARTRTLMSVEDAVSDALDAGNPADDVRNAVNDAIAGWEHDHDE